MPSLPERLRAARVRKNLSQTEVYRRTGINNKTLSGYERGISKPDYETLFKLAELYGVSTQWLLYGDKSPIDKPDKKSENSTYNSLGGDRDWAMGLGQVIETGEMIMIPIITSIACGKPAYAEDEILGYLPMGTALLSGNPRDYVFLRAEGDSMIGADIKDGSFVLIKKQPTADNGDIVAVCIHDENATLKRIYFHGDMVVLAAENPKYMPQTYHVSEIRIVGKAVMVTKTL